MSEITIEECRARGLALPADADAAQDVIDEWEAWLARRIGLLVGSRAETFYVGLGRSTGKLALARYTDAVTLIDGGVAVDTGQYRLVDRGAAVHRVYAAASQIWTGPYVVATYSPNDELEVHKALFDLVGLSLQAPVGGLQSETIGSYSYSRGTGLQSPEATRAAIVSALLPKHDPATTLHSHRPLAYGDPVINRPEPAW